MSSPTRRWPVAMGFLSLYLIWGSTYLGIRIAVETIPPFLLAGARFAAAGLVLMVIRRLMGIRLPSGRETIGAIGVGICLVVLSNVPVVWVEQRVASGIVAVFAAGTPLLIALFNGRRTGTALGRQRAVGLALGTVGILLLASATFSAVHDPLPLLLLATASFSWAYGSTYARDWASHPDHLMASATQMLAGGVIALAIGVAAGEARAGLLGTISLPSLLAWSYLAIAGSLIAYPVFQWLLHVADATSVASYTYVNPVVALVLGALLAHERPTTAMLLASAVLIPAVGLVVTGSPKPSARLWEVKGET